MTPTTRLLGLILAGTVLSAHCQNFLTNGLVAYYPFNGNANDARGANNGTVFGATLTSDRFGNPSKAYSFDGATTYIQCPDTGLPAGSSPRTVSFWLKVASFGNPSPTITYPFSYGVDGATNAFYATVDAINSGGPYIAVGKSGGGDTPRWKGPITNVWYHATITYSNLTASIFVNGANLAQASRTYVTTLTGNFYIGRYVGGFPPTFYGTIDDVRVYNRALSSTEVQQLYQYESGAAQLSSASPALRLGTTNLMVGASYQIQESDNLINWTNYGNPFVAVSTNAPQYIDAMGSQGFYRIQPAQ